MRPANWPAPRMSAVYLARPETFSGPSIIGTYEPMLCAGVGLFMAPPHLRSAPPRPRSSLRNAAEGRQRGKRAGASWRDALSAERHGKFHRLDDFHVTGAAADITAERLQAFCIGRIRVFPQRPGRGHNEAWRAIAALRAELFMEAALDRRELPVRAKRFNGVDTFALNGCGQSETGERRP